MSYSASLNRRADVVGGMAGAPILPFHGEPGSGVGPAFHGDSPMALATMDEQRDARMAVISDDEGRQIAKDIRKQRPGWLVIFGVYSRQFVAFPLFSVNQRTILIARYPEALMDRMVRAEQERRMRPERQEQ